MDITLANIGYSDWVSRHDTRTEDDRRRIRHHINALPYRPLISILMPVCNPPAEFLGKVIASVQRQLYQNWELCIAGDASIDPLIRALLEQAARDDTRIHVSFRPFNGHLSVASNTALAMAQGEFVALLDQDDEFTEHALYHLIVALNDNRELDLLYGDEDKIDANGQRFGHYFKPDWNPDLFLSQNLVSHLGAYRRKIADAIGGFRQDYEGAQDWDFALRFVDVIHADHIHHIPHVLYHLRAIVGPTTVEIDAQQHTFAPAQAAALQDHWRRRGIALTVVAVAAGRCTTSLPLPVPAPLVSIIICTRNRVDLLRQCVEGVTQKTDYENIEIIIVDNGSDENATLVYLDSLRASGAARIVLHPAAFNFAELNNLAVQQAQGELICLLNNDVVPINSEWLTEMAAHALRPEIGAVGAKLYYPNDTIQHAGVLLNGVAAEHLHLGYKRSSVGYGNRACLAQNYSAVTAACLVIRKSTWEEVGGMDETFAVAFNDVDFCLRVRRQGYRNLWLPQVELYHYESASRGKEDTPEKCKRFLAEVELLQKRWGRMLANDPAWNPNLALSGERIGLASPPRISQPWRATF
ncbi:MAG: glycosyl transferase family 2 [Betaproteobacteria bacterium HGW-Betaproteobacteria-18]|nr:MAG: glycosyl transferase family 2 [Betaproteobacteria bacterium HGW-Betaproteobacteria-18]